MISMFSIESGFKGSFKTSLKKNDHNPKFNEIMVFAVSSQELNKIFFKVTVYQVKEDTKEEIEIGKFIIEPNRNNNYESHMNKMIRLLRRQVTQANLSSI